MRHIKIFIVFFLTCSSTYPSAPIEFKEHYYLEQNFQRGQISGSLPERVLKGQNSYDHPYFKPIYRSTGGIYDESILFKSNTLEINDSQKNNTLSKSQLEPKFSFWSFLYLYVSLIGFYIALIINFNRKIDYIARILISAFVFIHSFFILHICLNITNYQYQFPHSYLMSTSFSFLYGPLLYFYFKRITLQYSFRKIDFIHLVPTILFVIYILPTYLMSGEEKLDLMIDRVAKSQNPSDSAQLIIIVLLKLVSLIIYGHFIRKLYLNSRKMHNINRESKIWQKNVFHIHFLYIASYAIYGILISNGLSSGFFYHFQVIAMALMVLYVGYSANIQPNVVSGLYAYGANTFFPKYIKSGLTQSLSEELKANLLQLFEEEEIYKENDISLDTVAERLNTSRHNASQVINEHFKMNFHELVNKYRIKEAKSILKTDLQGNLNIIDVAYEVGYNNKVTFNKAFKKDTNLTPSQYQKSAIGIRV